MIRFAAIISVAALLAGCTTGSDINVSSSAQPRTATWRCTGGAQLTVVNERSQITVDDSRGGSYTLPADPASQRERYGDQLNALVFEGRAASWFANGKQPVDCKR